MGRRSVRGEYRNWVPLAAGAAAIVAPAAHANVGLPMIAVEMPLMALAIVPIILIEGWILHAVTRIPARECGSVAMVSNIFSTVIGLPLAWMALFALQEFTGGTEIRELAPGVARYLSVARQGAWLMPNRYEMYWMLPSALLLLQVPFCVASCASEYWVSARRMKTQPRRVVLRAVLIGNGITYGLLMLFALCLLLTAKAPAT